jgi:uncharacterized SAM-dependent methyltransferase
LKYLENFDFRQGETILTENSRRFEIDALKALIGQCGRQMVDSAGWTQTVAFQCCYSKPFRILNALLLEAVK